MYSTLLILHSIFRWAVLLSLVTATVRAYVGYTKQQPFSKLDDSLRHWTATIAHIQLVLGILLYIKSPLIQYFWSNKSEAISQINISFFALIHSVLMLTSVVVVTIGSALAKRKTSDHEKYKTLLLWFTLSLILILVAIPWPFSLFANRPYFRTF